MLSRYIRPNVDYQTEVPNNPFKESERPVAPGDLSIQTSAGSVDLGDLTVIKGKLRINSGINDNGNHDYGVF